MALLNRLKEYRARLGINQTELRVFLVLQADMTAILGGYSAEVYVENQICIAQVLIVGQVPQTYVQ